MQGTPDPTPPSWPSGSLAERGALALTAIALLVALILAMAQRGPWYDEFYTLYVTRPGFGLGEAFWRHWLPDNHPPLFYALSRATGWLGDGVEVRRLVNAGIAVGAFGCGLMVVRRAAKASALAPIAVAFFLVLAAQPATLLHGAELRSYFLSLCAAALLVLTLTASYLDGEAGGRWRRFTLCGALFLSFNIHIATTVIAGAIVLPFLAAFAWQRNFALLRAVLLPALASGAVFLAVTAIQMPLWDANTASFWIAPGMDTARWTIETFALRVISANPLLSAAGAAGIGALLWEFVRRRRRSAELDVAVILGTGGLIAVAALLALHSVRPCVIEKYLIALIAPVAMLLAIGTARLLRLAGPRLAGVIWLVAAAASLLAIRDNWRLTVGQYSWEGTAALIGEQHARCPDIAVHTDPFWNAEVYAMRPGDNRQVIPLAYRTMAARFGFRIEPAGSRRMAESCPTLFWAEHDTRSRFTAAQILKHVREQGFAVPGVTIYRVGDGWVASTRPLVLAAP